MIEESGRADSHSSSFRNKSSINHNFYGWDEEIKFATCKSLQMK